MSVKDKSSDFFITQIQQDFDKIRIIDKSIEKSEHKKAIISYFKAKFERDKQQATHNTFEFIDLFCGAGGLSLGFEQEGFKPCLALDKDESALRTYRFNRPHLKADKVINEDIRHIVEDHVFEFVPLIIGGPPCQGFSNANKQRKENDDRNKLYKFFVHSVNQAKPDVFLLENVEGILAHIDVIEKDFNEVSYSLFSPTVLNTKDFGYPQNRKRAFIVGVHSKYEGILDELQNLFIDTIHGEKGKVNFCLWDAIFDLPEIEAKTAQNRTYYECKRWGYTYGQFIDMCTPYAKLINNGYVGKMPVLNHKSKYNNTRDIEIYSRLLPGEKSDAESIKDINPYKNRAGIFKDKFYKLLPNEPCKTITAHMYYDCHMYIHPYSARGLSPREAARVQGFPDDYLFLGTPNEWYRQIGNAVSPLLARVLGKGLKNILKRIYRV